MNRIQLIYQVIPYYRYKAANPCYQEIACIA